MAERKILVAIDEPNWASVIIQSLFNLIKKENTEIILLNVLETNMADEGYFYSKPEKFIKHESRKSNFAYVEDLLEKEGFKYQFIFKEGNVSDNIIKLTKKLGIDLVVIGSHNKKIFETFFLGSVSYKVSRLCKCSVMIVSSKYHIHNTRKKNFNVLLTVDNSKYSIYAAEKLHELLDLKRSKIDILNVTIPPQNVIPPEAYIYTDLGKIIEESRHVSNEILDKIFDILKKYDVAEVKKTSLMGDPSSLIVDYAENNSIDLIVMGSHGKKELAALFLGSTSIKVTEKSEIPLLLIKRQ